MATAVLRHTPPPAVTQQASRQRQRTHSIKTAFAAFSLAASLSPREGTLRFNHKRHDITEFNKCVLQWIIPRPFSFIASTHVALAGLNHKAFLNRNQAITPGVRRQEPHPPIPPCLLQRAGVKLASPFGGAARPLCLTIRREFCDYVDNGSPARTSNGASDCWARGTKPTTTRRPVMRFMKLLHRKTVPLIPAARSANEAISRRGGMEQDASWGVIWT